MHDADYIHSILPHAVAWLEVSSGKVLAGLAKADLSRVPVGSLGGMGSFENNRPSKKSSIRCVVHRAGARALREIRSFRALLVGG